MPSRRWARVRKLALERAGYRSELSGKAGVLEVDHIVPVSQGGARFDLDNLQVLTRGEHIAKTRRERGVKVSPARARWNALVEELQTTTTPS